jgi:cytochrome b subunit of formate dehydrogenase
MGLTGAIMWFENVSMGFLTKLGWDISRTVHFYEAWLAMLAILVWHIYYVVVNPDVYPMNTAWLTGTITEKEMEEEHPLELEEIKKRRLAQRQPAPVADPAATPASTAPVRRAEDVTESLPFIARAEKQPPQPGSERRP